MAAFFDMNTLREAATSSLATLGTRLRDLLPSVAGAALILLVGWLISRLLAAIGRRALERLGLDRASERVGLREMLRRANVVAAPSMLIARLLFWTLMLTFVLAAVQTLGLSMVTTTIDRLISYLPNVAAAGLIVIVGLLLARVAENLVRSGSAMARLPGSDRLGAATNAVVVLIVVVLALEQLGVETDILVTISTVLVATIGLTIGGTLALGARGVVGHILAGHYLRQNLPLGETVEVQGRRGVVERVGPVDTRFRDGARSWTIPNARLLDEVVER